MNFKIFVLNLAPINFFIQYSNQIILDHVFQIVDNNFPIPCLGILGKDYVEKHKCNIDFVEVVWSIPYSHNLNSFINIRPESDLVCLSKEICPGTGKKITA